MFFYRYSSRQTSYEYLKFHETVCKINDVIYNELNVVDLTGIYFSFSLVIIGDIADIHPGDRNIDTY